MSKKSIEMKFKVRRGEDGRVKVSVEGASAATQVSGETFMGAIEKLSRGLASEHSEVRREIEAAIGEK